MLDQGDNKARPGQSYTHSVNLTQPTIRLLPFLVASLPTPLCRPLHALFTPRERPRRTVSRVLGCRGTRGSTATDLSSTKTTTTLFFFVPIDCNGPIRGNEGLPFLVDHELDRYTRTEVILCSTRARRGTRGRGVMAPRHDGGFQPSCKNEPSSQTSKVSGLVALRAKPQGQRQVGQNAIAI